MVWFLPSDYTLTAAICRIQKPARISKTSQALAPARGTSSSSLTSSSPSSSLALLLVAAAVTSRHVTARPRAYARAREAWEARYWAGSEGVVASRWWGVEMISQFFVLSQRGDHIVFRDCKIWIPVLLLLVVFFSLLRGIWHGFWVWFGADLVGGDFGWVRVWWGCRSRGGAQGQRRDLLPEGEVLERRRGRGGAAGLRTHPCPSLSPLIRTLLVEILRFLAVILRGFFPLV